MTDTLQGASLFEPIRLPKRRSDMVVEQITRLIDEGALKAGDRLPGEREMMKQFSVGRTSVREALRTLETLGKIKVRSGEGIFVNDRMDIAPLSSRWNWVLVQRKEEIASLLEVREALESKASALAARRALDEDIQRIHEAIEKMERGVENADLALIVSGDVEFHDRVSEASKNQTLIDLNQLINQLLLETRYAFFDIPGKALESCEQHRAVFEAIKSRDGDAATAAMLNHVWKVTADIMELM